MVEAPHRHQNKGKLYHVPLPNARASKLFLGGDYGFLLPFEGREIYFHRNSLVKGEFEKLKAGTGVRLREEQGVKGPQVAAVCPLARQLEPAYW